MGYYQMDHYTILESRRRRAEKEADSLSEKLMAEHFSNLGTKRDIQIQLEWIKRSLHWDTLRSNCHKSNTKNFESSKIKATHHLQGAPIRLWGETLQARRKWDNILKVLKDKNCQPRMQNLVKLSFKRLSQVSWRNEFITTQSALQERLKGVLSVKNRRQKYIKDINA